MDDMRDEDRHEQLAEELRLLLDAAAGRAEEYLRGCEAPEDGQACCRCPFCAAMTLVRGQRTDITEQLLGVVQLLRQALAEHRDETPAPPAADEEDVAEPKVQRIQVQRVRGPVLTEQDASC
ncbi:hypothetical protein GCM10009854_15620 [Saccharopolyspora halophila]|uniref:Uncharacterized protein n=1 Tax=Saccharopolyspora halophila TaxID=405551 RepID=A0ABP5SZN2_9PSEU